MTIYISFEWSSETAQGAKLNVTLVDKKGIEYKGVGQFYSEIRGLSWFELRPTQAVSTASATKVKLSKTKATLTVGGMEQILGAVVLPSNASQTVTWSSSDEAVATVSQSGSVTPIQKGTAKITATTTNGKKATCKITVALPKPDGVVLSDSTKTIMAGTTWIPGDS